MYYFENALTGFFSNELSVVHESRFLIPNKRYFFEDGAEDGNYYIIYVEYGKFSFECSNSIVEIEHGDFVIVRPYEKFKLYTKYLSKMETITDFTVIMISFDPSLFNSTVGDDNFLRAFNDRKIGQNNVYKNSVFDKESIVEDIIKQLNIYTKKNLGLYHFKAAIAMMITQISMIFDESHNENPVNSTNDYKLKIYDYILRNSCNKITLNEVSEKFNASHWYINSVTKKFYGKTFRETVHGLRMFRARGMMSRMKDLAQISRLVGYSSYSGFYKKYTNYFGITPEKDYLYFKKHGDFYNKHKSYEDTIS